MRKLFFYIGVCCLLQTVVLGQHMDNGPAILRRIKDSLTLEYQQQLIVALNIHSHGNPYHIGEKKERMDGKMFQTIVITSDNGQSIEIVAGIVGSFESFPCESEQPAGLKIVRHVVGLSHSLLNNAVYDRRADWLLSVDRQTAAVNILPD